MNISKNTKVYWVLCCFALVLTILLAEKASAGPDDDAMMGRPTFGENGKIFVVEFSPEGRRIDINLTGNPVATIDPDSVTVLGKVYPNSGKSHELNLVWLDNHYQIRDQLRPSDHIDIKVKDRRTEKVETFHFNNPHPKTDGDDE